MFTRRLTTVLAPLCVMVSTNAFAATISGKINDSNNAGLAGMEVRLWAEGEKQWEIAELVVSNADGTYTFSDVPTGEYRLDARMAPGIEGNYGDTWYDSAPPTSNGLIAADADILSVADGDTLTGINVTLPILGGLDARIVASGTPLEGLIVRAESKQDPRIHHNDFTDGPCCGTNPHLGQAYFRGLAPSATASTYRLLIYDFDGIYATTVAPGPYTVTADSKADAGDVSVAAIGPDPNEPNDSETDPGTPTVTSLPYAPTDVALSPRGDVDWYCFNGQAGERYVAAVSAHIDVEGTPRAHPWFDPMVALWNGSSIVASNDDAVPGESLDAALDVRNLPTDGRYCFIVSTFGDDTFDGSGQLSAGEYDVEIKLGNRPPTIGVAYDGAPAPVAPDEITVDEDVTVVFEIDFSDPDGDALTLQVEHRDNNGASVMTGVLDQSVTPATYTWTPSQSDGALSPFELTFRVNDGEFDLRYPVVVRVSPVSVPPTVPVLIAPEDEAIVEGTAAELRLENSTDADGDTLSYDFQVEFGEPDNAPEIEANEPEDSSGETATVAMGLPENTWISWRARAFDGADYSAWSEWRRFFVDSMNDAPDPPTIVKPENNEELPETTVTIASTIPADPEGDEVSVLIELARDGDFADLVATSGALAAGMDETMVSWEIEEPLARGGIYFARAFAEDESGARSGPSEIVAFSIRSSGDFQSPSFGGDFAGCGEVELGSGFGEVEILNVDDSGDAVTFEVAILAAGDESTVLVSTQVPQSDGDATVTTIAAPADPGSYLIRVRATRGEESTAWTECRYTVTGDGGPSGGGSDSGIEDEGCGCATGGGSPAAILTLVVGLFIARRRRRSWL